VLWGAIKTRSLIHTHHAKENNKMDFKKILEHFADAEAAVKKQNLNEAAFAKSGVKADAKKNKADATTRKQYFVKLANAKGGSKGVTVMADEGESESEVRSRVGRDHKSQGWTVSSIREKGDAAEKAAAGEKNPAVTASGKKRGRPPGSKKAVTEGRQTVSEYIAEARMMERHMSDVQKGERERIVKGMKKAEGDFENRYPGRGKAVMYATATKRAMKEDSGESDRGYYKLLAAKAKRDPGSLTAREKEKLAAYLRIKQMMGEPALAEDDSMMGMTLDQAKQHPSYKTDTAFKADVDAAEKFSSSLSSDKKPKVMTTDQAKKDPAYAKDPAFKARVDKTKPTTGMVVSSTGQQTVAESASKFSPEMHDRIKNATPQQLSQMASNFAGPGSSDRYDYELELLMKAQKELQGVAESAPTYDRKHSYFNQPDGTQVKTREAARELFDVPGTKYFEIDVFFPAEPDRIRKNSAAGRFRSAIMPTVGWGGGEIRKPNSYRVGRASDMSDEQYRVYSPSFSSPGVALASFTKVMDLIDRFGGTLTGDYIVVYTDAKTGRNREDWVDTNLENLPKSSQGVAEGSASGRFQLYGVRWNSKRKVPFGSFPTMDAAMVKADDLDTAGFDSIDPRQDHDELHLLDTQTGQKFMYTDDGDNKEWEPITGEQGVAEGAKCNHTEEGEECPVHGLEECGTYMEESRFDEDLAQMKKIAGVGAVAAAGLGAHISGENAEIRTKEVKRLEKKVASEPDSVKRGQLEKMINDIKAGKPLSKGDIISEVNPHRYDSDVDYYDAEEAEQARLRGDYDDAEEAHYDAQADQREYDHQAAWDDMREDAEDDAEYSDEVGMVENNLETIERAAEELDSILQDGEDLPEWIEEKVSNAKAMLVAAKEYMASQHANGVVRRVDDEEMDEGAGVMHFKAQQAKADGKDSFKLGDKEYPVKESRSAVDELAECYDMAYQQAQAEPEQRSHMSVSANTSSEGNRTLTVTAEGDMADELAQLLSLSGLAGGHGHQAEMEESAQDEFQANTRPEPATFSLHRLLDAGDDLNAPKAQHPAAAARGDNPLTR
jgi:hypothetical protein